jgi:hypothetical protein
MGGLLLQVLQERALSESDQDPRKGHPDMKLKNKKCDLGHWMEPRIENTNSIWADEPEFHFWWQCETCECQKALAYLAEKEKERAKKVRQKSDMQVKK